MKQALDLAEIAYHANEVPVGAIIVNPEGQVIGQGYNQKESKQLATAHAEILAINEACKNSKSWRLSDCTLYVTLEPCPMCSGAIWASQIKEVIFGATDTKTGYLQSLYQLGQDQKLNHRFKSMGGVLGEDCSELLRVFFRRLRGKL